MTDPPPEREAEVLWGKLRRRKIVQWGLAYLAIAWGLLQVLEFAVATFAWPEAITRGAAVAAVGGLAVVVTLAWYHGDSGQQRVTRGEILVLLTLACGAALAAWQAARTVPERTAEIRETAPERASPRLDRRRVAVLPFANLGNDPANAAFVGGVHDTLIAQIARVPGLSIISRSSVLQYEGKTPTIRDVAAALHVGSVLEGSVQRDGNRLRIHAQLIDATTDEHVWAETYDRSADDLFALQTEIALAVAEKLRIKLSAGDAEQVAALLTSNPRAYEHYVLAQQFFHVDFPKAIAELTAAVTLDPAFAAAYAQRSIARTWLSHHMPGPQQEQLELAEVDARRALELDPTLPEGHFARAVFYYRGKPDIDRAASEFERAIAGLPSNAEVHLSFGFLRRWQGRLEEALALFQHGAELDPSGPADGEVALMLAALNRPAEALAALEAASTAAPDSPDLPLIRARIAVATDCDLAAAERLLAQARRQFPDNDFAKLAQRQFALQIGDAQTAVVISDDLASTQEGAVWERGEIEPGQALLMAGRLEDARSSLRKARDARLQDARAGSGNAGNEFATAALVSALLRERERAIEYAERSLELMPTLGAWNRKEALLDCASALAHVGEIPAAIERLRDWFAEVPSPMKASGVWCFAGLAPLRADPRFRKLIEEHGGNTSVDPFNRATWPRATAAAATAATAATAPRAP